MVSRLNYQQLKSKTEHWRDTAECISKFKYSVCGSACRVAECIAIEFHSGTFVVSKSDTYIWPARAPPKHNVFCNNFVGDKIEKWGWKMPYYLKGKYCETYRFQMSFAWISIRIFCGNSNMSGGEATYACKVFYGIKAMDRYPAPSFGQFFVVIVCFFLGNQIEIL